MEGHVGQNKCKDRLKSIAMVIRNIRDENGNIDPILIFDAYKTLSTMLSFAIRPDERVEIQAALAELRSYDLGIAMGDNDADLRIPPELANVKVK